ncbi:hypothetical protein BH11PLA1_BH11PLA1_19290 [soil metagenome]
MAPACRIVLCILLLGLCAAGLLSCGMPKPGEASADQSVEEALRKASIRTYLASENRKLAEEPLIKERRARIEAELLALDRDALPDSDWAKEWAGTYHARLMKVYICLAPKAGITLLNYTCTGLGSVDHGDVCMVHPDGLDLSLKFGFAENRMLSERLYFVRWGDERFLVSEHLLLEMVNDYNQGGLSRELLLSIPRLVSPALPERWRPPPAGRPDLPPAYARLLHDDPLPLKVTAITKIIGPATRGERGWTVELAGGTDQGVFAGMEFRNPSYRAGRSGTYRVTRVDTTSCTAEFSSYHGVSPAPVGSVVYTGETERLSSEP